MVDTLAALKQVIALCSKPKLRRVSRTVCKPKLKLKLGPYSSVSSLRPLYKKKKKHKAMNDKPT